MPLDLKTLTAHLVYDHLPCVVIVKSSSSKDTTEDCFTHAISLCSKGFLHDPDFEVPYRLLGPEYFQSWLEMDDLQIVQAYIMKQSRRRKKKNFSSIVGNGPFKKSRSE
jgi:ABC-type oligopeptide transport system substrate-binding subunit